MLWLIVFSVLAALTALSWQQMRGDLRSEIHFRGRRVLILTAHPDDESMFFSPMLMAMKQDRPASSRSVHLLCLSAGHYRNAPEPNLGDIRTRELHRAATILGVDDCVVENLTDGALVRAGPSIAQLHSH